MADKRSKWLIVAGIVAVLIIAFIIIFHPGTSAAVDSYKECVSAGYPVTSTNPPVCNDGHKNFVGPLASQAPVVEENIQTLDYTILVEGDSKGVYPAKNQVITSQAAWQSFWRAVHSKLPSLPPLLPVDFSKNDVIALTMGVEPTGSYSIHMLSLVQNGQSYQAVVEYRQPGPDCKLPTLKTDPYFLASVPKLHGPVAFETSTATNNCGN